MKRFFFIIVTLFAVTLANAQITLEQTFEGSVYVPNELKHGPDYDESGGGSIYGDILMSTEWDKKNIKVFDAFSYNELAVIQKPYLLVAKGILTGDNNLAYITYTSLESSNQIHLYVKNAIGDTIQDLGIIDGKEPQQHIYTLSDNSKKLYIKTIDSNFNYKTYIYALPANGSTPSNIIQADNKTHARKYLHNNQVLIDSNKKTFTVQGKEVK